MSRASSHLFAWFNCVEGDSINSIHNTKVAIVEEKEIHVSVVMVMGIFQQKILIFPSCKVCE